MAKQTKFTSVEQYVASLDEDVRPAFERLRRAIRRAAPTSVESISYQIPTFKQDGRGLISIAAWKKHIALYPIPAGSAAFQKRTPIQERQGYAPFSATGSHPLTLVRQIVAYQLRALRKRAR
jgi:uncharacterized protein YdhG (YjbR/CyaY superfamily)